MTAPRLTVRPGGARDTSDKSAANAAGKSKRHREGAWVDGPDWHDPYPRLQEERVVARRWRGIGEKHCVAWSLSVGQTGQWEGRARPCMWTWKDAQHHFAKVWSSGQWLCSARGESLLPERGIPQQAALHGIHKVVAAGWPTGMRWLHEGSNGACPQPSGCYSWSLKSKDWDQYIDSCEILQRKRRVCSSLGESVWQCQCSYAGSTWFKIFLRYWKLCW